MADGPLPENKPTLLLDFDGVIHAYSKGWEDGTIYDGPTEGFFEWAVEANKLFKLVVYSSRSNTEQGITDMKDWLQLHVIAWRHSQMERNSGIATALLEFEFPDHKPPAWLTIDDRAITFTGRWHDDKLRPEALRRFVPWHDPNYEEPEEAKERPSNVVPPPNTKNICPRHPWMTYQEPNGKRRCTAAGCTWQG
jgi:hypothetical protein